MVSSLWLAAGASAQVSEGVRGWQSEVGGGEIRSSLKAVKILVSPFKLSRACGAVPSGTVPRHVVVVFTPPGREMRCEPVPRLVRRPESLPPAPSLTGRIVILV